MAEAFLPLSEFSAKDVPWLLLPYQQRWIRDQSGFKLCSKSRRVGLSWAEAGDCALLASRSKGSDVFYVSYDKDMTRQFIEDAGEWAKLYQLGASQIHETCEVFRDGDEDKAVTIFRIYFNSGHRLEALSSSPRNLRSKQGRVVIDEAAFVDDLGGLIKAAKAMRLWERGDVRIISTYNGVDNEFYDLEKGIIAGKYPYSRHQITFRQAVSEGLYQRICLANGKQWSQEAEEEWIAATYAEFGDDAAEELDCVPNNSSGKYFPRALLERAMQDCTAPILQFNCKPEFTILPEAERIRLTDEWLRNEVAPHLERLQLFLPTAYGQDFARETLSCILIGQQQRNLRITSELGLELRGVPYEQQRQIAFWLFDHLPRLVGVAIDSTGNGGYLGEVAMQKLGSRALPVKLNAPWYAENFPRYKADLESDYFTLPPSTDWIDDHRLIESVKGQPTVPNKNTLGTDGKPRHGDSAIAAVLLKFAFLNQGGPLEFSPIPDPPPSRRVTFEQPIDWRSFIDR